MPASARLVLAVVVTALVVGVATSSGSARTQAPQAHSTVVVGALLDLSEGWTSLGRSSRATLRLAAANANARLAASGSATRVRLKIMDVAGDAAKSVAAVKQLAAAGVQVAIGPEKSSEVAAVRPVADRLGVIVVSQGSTAHSLAFDGDNVFRLVPDDRSEGAAMVALLRRQGTTALVPVWRKDPGNAGLVSSVRQLFRAAGGTVARGVPYAEGQKSFAGTVARASSQVRALKAQGKRVGVYLAAFDEVVDVADAAAGDATLHGVPWYGSDGVALTHAIVSDGAAAAFAAAVGYPNPTIGLDDAAAARAAGLLRRVTASLGHPPDTLSLAAYDALEIVARAAGAGGGSVTGSSLRRAATGYVGLSGTIELNGADDRAFGSFDFWSVCDAHGKATWRRTFSYLSTGIGKGRIVARERS